MSNELKLDELTAVLASSMKMYKLAAGPIEEEKEEREEKTHDAVSQDAERGRGGGVDLADSGQRGGVELTALRHYVQTDNLQALQRLTFTAADVLRSDKAGNDLFHFAAAGGAGLDMLLLLQSAVEQDHLGHAGHRHGNGRHFLDQHSLAALVNSAKSPRHRGKQCHDEIIKEAWLQKLKRRGGWRWRTVELTTASLTCSRGLLSRGWPPSEAKHGDSFALDPQVESFRHRNDILTGAVLTICRTGACHITQPKSLTLKFSDDKTMAEWADALAERVAVETVRVSGFVNLPSEVTRGPFALSACFQGNCACDTPLHLLAASARNKQAQHMPHLTSSSVKPASIPKTPWFDCELQLAKKLSWFIDNGCRLDIKYGFSKSALDLAQEQRNSYTDHLMLHIATPADDGTVCNPKKRSISAFTKPTKQLTLNATAVRAGIIPSMVVGYMYLALRLGELSVADACTDCHPTSDASLGMDAPRVAPYLCVSLRNCSKVIEATQAIVPVYVRPDLVWWGRNVYLKTPGAYPTLLVHLHRPV